MPWPWELVTYCMDLRNGTFLTWPYPDKHWREQKTILDAMKTVWRATQHKIKTKNPRYKWTPEDLDYETWLTEGLPQLEEAPSPYEIWLEKQNGSS